MKNNIGILTAQRITLVQHVAGSSDLEPFSQIVKPLFQSICLTLQRGVFKHKFEIYVDDPGTKDFAYNLSQALTEEGIYLVAEIFEQSN